MNRAEHDAIYERGIEVDPHLAPIQQNIEGVENIKKLLEDYTARHGEEVVLAAWVQPGGGPTLAYRLHTRSEVERVHAAYDRDPVLRKACPQMGVFYDIHWCEEEKNCLQNPSVRPEPQEYLPDDAINFMKHFLAERQRRAQT